MGWIIIFLLVAVPVIEFATFAKVSGLIGVLPTILLSLVAAIGGIWILRRQGLSVLFQLRDTLERGEMPLPQLIDGSLLLVAGGLLLLPGLVSDLFGFLLLVPPIRAFLVRHFTRSLTSRPGPDKTIIDVDYHVVRDHVVLPRDDQHQS